MLQSVKVRAFTVSELRLEFCQKFIIHFHKFVGIVLQEITSAERRTSDGGFEKNV